jgi:histidine ammonia-lyase
MTMLTIGDAPLTLAQLRGVLDGPVMVTITSRAWADVERGDGGGDRG